MKKILAVVMAFTVSVVSAFAVDVSLGVRGNVAVNAGSTFEGDFADSVSKSSDMVWGGGFSLYTNIGFFGTDNFMIGIQPELGIQFNNGVKKSESGVTLTVTNHTFEIPVLLTMTYNVTPNVYFGGGIGPYVSFQMGKMKVRTDGWGLDSTDNYSSKGAAFGMAFDFKTGVKAGTGSFVFDIRYLLNFNKTRAEVLGESFDVFTRRALTFGVGYEVKF